MKIAKELNIPTPKSFSKFELNNPLFLKRLSSQKLVVKPSTELADKKVDYLKINDFGKIKNLDFDNSLVQEYIEGGGYGFCNL